MAREDSFLLPQARTAIVDSAPKRKQIQGSATGPKVAACIAAAYFSVVLGGILLHFFQTGDTYTLKYGLMLPTTWAALTISGFVSWGLWHRFRWAWWLGFIAAALQLLRMSSWVVRHFSTAAPPGLGVVLVLALLLALLAVLLLPRTRRACTR